jgi:Fe-S-cluster containining protein
MRCSNCGVCCTETEMLLSKKDIKRLQAKGYSASRFVRYDKDGYARLRNRNGYCVFYDSKARRCSVYADRPSGCRVYPVILDEEKGIVTDDICQSRETVTENEKKLKGSRVMRLLRTIDSEAEVRRLGKNA